MTAVDRDVAPRPSWTFCQDEASRVHARAQLRPGRPATALPALASAASTKTVTTVTRAMEAGVLPVRVQFISGSAALAILPASRRSSCWQRSCPARGTLRVALKAPLLVMVFSRQRIETAAKAECMSIRSD